MSKLSSICPFFLVICSVMGTLSSAKSISNDSEPTEHQIPKSVGDGGNFTEKYKDTVFRLDWNSTSCTGTFIAPNAILTAAQCCKNVNSSRMTIYNPDHGNVGGGNVTVLEYHFLPRNAKNGALKLDLVIIELTENISHIIPAKLDYTEVDCGSTVWMYGFGRTELNRTGASVTLKELSSKIVKCSWYQRFFTRDDMIVTYSKNGSMCDGDAGGPMFNQNGKLVGVLSAGGDNCSTSELNYSERISLHASFIQRFLHPDSGLSALVFLLFLVLFFISGCFGWYLAHQSKNSVYLT